MTETVGAFVFGRLHASRVCHINSFPGNGINYVLGAVKSCQKANRVIQACAPKFARRSTGHGIHAHGWRAASRRRFHVREVPSFATKLTSEEKAQELLWFAACWATPAPVTTHQVISLRDEIRR